MKARAFMFTGNCAGGCGRKLDHEAAVALTETDDDLYGGSWLCASCATRIGVRLITAAADARSRVRRGLEFIHDKWIKRKERVQRSSDRSVVR